MPLKLKNPKLAFAFDFKRSDPVVIHLTHNPKILKSLGNMKLALLAVFFLQLLQALPQDVSVGSSSLSYHIMGDLVVV